MSVVFNRRGCLRASMIAITWLALCARADAQPVPPSTRPGESTSKTAAPEPKKATPKAATNPTSPRPITGADQPEEPTGPRTRVLDDETFQKFLQWLKTQQSPAYNITSISLDGKADDQRAVLAAKISVQINRADEWVLVPLRMNDAVLLKPPVYEHPQDGEARFDGESDEDSGLSWWFRGKGQHQLTLQISVPVRKPNPGRRIQLPLPTPAAAASDLKLVVPMGQIEVIKRPEQSGAFARSLNVSTSEIAMFGLGTLLDLTWQPVPKRKLGKAELQATTLIAAEFTTESIVLEAVQLIRSRQGQGSFSDVTVRMPAGFELFDVQDHEYQHDPDDHNRVTVTLPEPTTGPIELRWTLYADDFLKQDVVPVVEGFEVENARSQTGYIAIVNIEGYHVSKVTDDNRFVYLVNVSRLRSSSQLRGLIGSEEISRGYRFLKQPFRLVLNVQEVIPYFTAEPKFALKFSADRADLDARFRFRIYRGAIREIQLPWPRWRQEAWKIEQSETSEIVEQILSDADSESASLTVRLVEQKTRADGEFEIRLKASRPIVSGDEDFDISLPSVQSLNRTPAILVIANAENVESDIRQSGETLVRPLPIHLQKKIVLADQFRQLQPDEFLRIDSADQSFVAQVTVYDQSIATQTSLDARLQRNRVTVTQRIIYNVAHVRLSQVRLSVPKELEDPIRFYLDADSTERLLLPPNWSDSEAERSKEARLTLDEPRLGSFNIVAEYTIEIADPVGMRAGQTIAVAVPLIQSADANFSSTRFAMANIENVDTLVSDPAWKQQLTLDDSTSWIVDGAQTSLALDLAPTTRRAPQNYSVTEAVVRTRANRSGPARSRAWYLLAGDVKSVELNFPDAIQPDSFWWGRQQLQPGQIEERPLGSGTYHLDVAGIDADETKLLMVDFVSNRPSSFGWSDLHQHAIPQFAESVRVARTIWEVVLPFDQYLFTQPDEFTPQFFWKRSVVFWSRVPYQDRFELAGDQLTGTVSAAGGNAYRFSCFGAPPALSFRSMNQSAIVGLGAGLALVVGFVLLKIPVTRHVLTFLILGFLVSVIGLWYAEPVHLLLQPAILGFLLAALAAVIDSSNKRKTQAPIVKTSSPSDFVEPSSAVDRSDSIVIGSNEVTEHRSAPVAAPQPVSSSNLGHEL